MATDLNELLDHYEQGTLNRRQFFRGLALAASAGAFEAAAEAN